MRTGKQPCRLPFSSCCSRREGKGHSRDRKRSVHLCFAACLLWDSELQHINVLMPELLFKVTEPQPEQAVGSQSKGLQWAFSFPVSPWHCFSTGFQFGSSRRGSFLLAGLSFGHCPALEVTLEKMFCPLSSARTGQLQIKAQGAVGQGLPQLPTSASHLPPAPTPALVAQLC